MKTSERSPASHLPGSAAPLDPPIHHPSGVLKRTDSDRLPLLGSVWPVAGTGWNLKGENEVRVSGRPTVLPPHSRSPPPANEGGPFLGYRVRGVAAVSPGL